jgi:hypothetical protein
MNTRKILRFKIDDKHNKDEKDEKDGGVMILMFPILLMFLTFINVGNHGRKLQLGAQTTPLNTPETSRLGRLIDSQMLPLADIQAIKGKIFGRLWGVVDYSALGSRSLKNAC